MTNHVTVQLTPAAARSMHRALAGAGDRDDAARGLLALAERHDARWTATHAGTDDAQLLTFFDVEVSDDAAARRLIQQLLETDAVEGAYQQPPPALPQ